MIRVFILSGIVVGFIFQMLIDLTHFDKQGDLTPNPSPIGEGSRNFFVLLPPSLGGWGGWSKYIVTFQAGFKGLPKPLPY
jgi:hypothetical protein